MITRQESISSITKFDWHFVKHHYSDALLSAIMVSVMALFKGWEETNLSKICEHVY
jgi:hypothetical protein